MQKKTQTKNEFPKLNLAAVDTDLQKIITHRNSMTLRPLKPSTCLHPKHLCDAQQARNPPESCAATLQVHPTCLSRCELSASSDQRTLHPPKMFLAMLVFDLATFPLLQALLQTLNPWEAFKMKLGSCSQTRSWSTGIVGGSQDVSQPLRQEVELHPNCQ